MKSNSELTIRVLEKPGASIPMVVYLSSENDCCVVYALSGVAQVYSGSGLAHNWEDQYLQFIADGGQDALLFRFCLEDLPRKDLTFDHFVEVLRKTINRPREQVLHGIANLFANGIF